MLGFKDTSTLMGHFVLSPREREMLTDDSLHPNNLICVKKMSYIICVDLIIKNHSFIISLFMYHTCRISVKLNKEK